MVPGYVNAAPELQAAGVDAVLMSSVADGAVMKAWSKDEGVPEGGLVRLLADPRMELTYALGMLLDHHGPRATFGNLRCKRFSMLVDHGVIKSINVAEGVDDPAGDERPEHAMAPHMLKELELLASEAVHAEHAAAQACTGAQETSRGADTFLQSGRVHPMQHSSHAFARVLRDRQEALTPRSTGFRTTPR